jgi:hypothetical protein
VSYKSGKDLPKEDEVKELKLYVGKPIISQIFLNVCSQICATKNE